MPDSTNMDLAAVAQAVDKLRSGELVAFPTETVYGLGADAANDDAVKKIYARKGRPSHHPLIVHLAGAEFIDRWTRNLDPRLRQLGDTFWPGALTIIAERSPDVSTLVTGGLDSVGVRVPSHPMALELLRRFGGGIAAPSANRFGRVSPTTASDVHKELGDDLYVLDGGKTQVGLESTIVTVEQGRLVILRHGGIPIERIREAVGEVHDDTFGRSRASGMMESHYAPSCEIVLCEPGVDVERLSSAVQGSAVMGLASDLPHKGISLCFPMSSIEEYAQMLYTSLRSADEAGATRLVAVLPPRQGLGAAIRDRLTRAASAVTQQEDGKGMQ